MSKEKGKIVNLVIDILCIVLCVVLLFVAICNIASRGKGYVVYFGKFNSAIVTNSMWPYNEDGSEKADATLDYLDTKQDYVPSFQRGDRVTVREYKTDEAKISNIEVGDVITYWGLVNGNEGLINHRVTRIGEVSDSTGTHPCYYVKGDRAVAEETMPILLNKIVGEVTKVTKNAGNFTLWMHNLDENGQPKSTLPIGFFLFIVLPSILIVGYFLVMLILSLSKRDVAKVEVAKSELEAQVRAELEAKLRAEMGLPPVEAQPQEQPATQEEPAKQEEQQEPPKE